MAIQRIQKSVEDIARVQKVPLLFGARNRSGRFFYSLALEATYTP